MRPESTTSRKVANATWRAVRHPRWLGEAVRGRLRARAGRARPFDLREHAEHLCTVPEALERAFGVTADQFAEVRSRIRMPDAPPGAMWGGGADLLTLLGSLVLLRRPERVLETGVAMGFTTAVILAAMDENGAGLLDSIDLPPMQVDAGTFVGQVVPDELRGRWTLHVGPTRSLLPGLARDLAPIDLFVHDSDHSYAGQSEDYRQAWPHVTPGGCFVSDDVDNPAFTDFADEVGARQYLMAPPNHNAAVGLLVKPDTR